MLTSATRAPRGKYSKENSWLLLQKRIPALARPRRCTPYILMLRITGGAVAAVALLLIALRLTVWNEPMLADIPPVNVSTLAETRTVTLPDGSIVTLNRYSTLTYPEQFDATRRDVHLRGEAYFDVRKDATRPFRVLTDDIDVRVLGTRFNVEAYEGDSQVSATLIEGSVSVVPNEHKEAPIILVPNERAVYRRSNHAWVRQPVSDATDETSWREGILPFRNLPLQEIARQLSNAFRTVIRIDNAALQQYRMTATFSYNDTLDEILVLLCRGRNLACVRQADGSILIHHL